MMFGQVVATGNLVWAPNSRNFEPESLDEHDLSTGDGMQKINESPNFIDARGKQADKGKSKMTNKKARSSTMDEIAETSRIIGHCMMEPPRIQILSSLYTIPEAITELETIPEVMDDLNYDFYHYCTMFLREKHNRETFVSIRQDRRLKWLQACFDKKSDELMHMFYLLSDYDVSPFYDVSIFWTFIIIF
ncbi:hypothetical protein KSP40_PGU006985 [Platanthera guangdongensis]|uniref:Uncharacterized protein n=1 Tax=Platanthera guangdongensis TaxID=2320717 RepID=A0ABR2MJQ8_9ASPA